MLKWLKAIEKKILSNRKAMIAILICEAFILLLVINLISQSASINKNDEKILEDRGFTDKVQCLDGKLMVNSVSVEVPKGDNVSYDIAYSWGPEDSELPSVPHAAIASVAGENGEVIYDISLYRDSVTAKKDVPKDKTADNWFDDWAASEEESEDPDNIQKIMKAGDINGFMISTTDKSDAESASSEYEVKTYYFAQKRKDGIAVYVLEGILYDPQSLEEFEMAFSGCMESIKLKK